MHPAAPLEESHANGMVHRDIKPAITHVGRLGLTEEEAAQWSKTRVPPSARVEDRAGTG